MAIAPSRLGRFVDNWTSDEALLQALRAKGLVRRRASDEQVLATFKRARDEQNSLPPGMREFNSPNERVRVFLAPYLTFKGRRWAVPLRGLNPPWWMFWAR